MDITTEFLSQYEGGQLEIQNSSEHYLYRGDVERAWVEGNTMRVRFKWLAKMANGKWHSEDDLDYAVSLEITHGSEISAGRFAYSIMFVSERGTFFPPNGSRLDPSQVEGLEIAGA